MSQHAQNPSKALPAVLSFEGAELKIIDRDGRPWIAGADLARALGYSNDRSVARIFKQHEHEFSGAMSTVLDLSTVKGMPYKSRVFSPRGCHLVAMFARTSRASTFRRWALDVLEQYEAGSAVDPVSSGRRYGDTELHGAALDLIQQAPALLLRDLRVMVSWDFDGKPQASVVPVEAVVAHPGRLAGVLRDPFTVPMEYLPEIIEAASQRLAEKSRRDARIRERALKDADENRAEREARR